MSRELLTTEGLLLRRVPYGDADLIVTLYTRGRGRLSALARAARKSKRRFSGALGLFTVSSMDLRGPRGSDLWILQRAEPAYSFASLALDLGTYAHASYGTELVGELTATEVADERIFALLIELYQSLSDVGPSPRVLRAFELALLGLTGVAPVLDHCVGCGSQNLDSRGMVLDPNRGGVCCSTCAAMGRKPGVRPLSEPARQALVQAQSVSALAQAQVLEVAPDVAGEARDALLAIVLGHVGKPLQSLTFIAKASAAAQALPANS